MREPGLPRPAEFRDAFIGAIFVLLGLYIGGGALWTWLFWPDQHFDLGRACALLVSGLMILFGYYSIETWVKGEWIEGSPYARGGSNSSQSEPFPNSGGDTGNPGGGNV